MNMTLIEAIWQCLKGGEAKTLATLATEAGAILQQTLNKFRLETELLDLVAAQKLVKNGDTFAAIPGKPLVVEKPAPPPKVRAPRKTKAVKENAPAEPEPAGGEQVLDEANKAFIKENVLRLGSRYAAERFYQEDAAVDWYARRLAAKLYPEEGPSKYCRRPKRRRIPPAASAVPAASVPPNNGGAVPEATAPDPGVVNN